MLNPQRVRTQDRMNFFVPGRALAAAILRGGFVQALALAVVLLCPSFADALPVSAEQARQGVRLAESALYLIDADSALGIEQAGSPLLQNKYVKLSEGVPLFGTGTFWLRFSLIGNAAGDSPPAGEHGQIVLRLPAGTPAAQVFVAQDISSGGEVRKWKEIAPQADGDFILPDPQKLLLTVYVKINGTPGLWFNPELLGSQLLEREGSAAYLPWILQGVLALSLLLCLLRGVSSREEWRLWASAVIGCALVQAIFLRQGTELSSIYLTTLPQLLAPGLAIMLIPHLGRHLLHSRDSKGLDYFLTSFSLLGVAAALLPLLPGLGWTVKLLPLAPLLLLPLLFLSLWLLAGKKTGAATFALLCLLPLGGAFLALTGLGLALLQGDLGHPLYLAGSVLTLWGYAAAGLLLALSTPASGDKKPDFFPLNDEFADGETLQLKDRTGEHAPELKLFEAHTIPDGSAESVSSTPPEPAETEPAGARLIEAGEKRRGESVRLPDLSAIFAPQEGTGKIRGLPPAGTQTGAGPQTAGPDGEDLLYIRDSEEPGLVIIKAKNSSPEDLNQDISYAAYLNERSSSLAVPLTQLSGSGAENSAPLSGPDAFPFLAPQQTDFSSERLLSELQKSQLTRLEESLRPSFEDLRQNLDELKRQQNTTENLTGNMEEILQALGLALVNLDRAAHGEPPEERGVHSIFNLSNLIRKAHAETLPIAEARGVTLSWFVAPSLPLLYKGDEDSIKTAITYMLRGAVESADSGAVQLAVRQAPDGGEGVIRFSLTDSAMNPQSMRRPARLLSRAWELARASHGSFSIEFVPEHGTSIHFSLKLEPLLNDEDAWEAEDADQGFPLPQPAAMPQLSLLPPDEALTPEPELEAVQASAERENGFDSPPETGVNPADAEDAVPEERDEQTPEPAPEPSPEDAQPPAHAAEQAAGEVSPETVLKTSGDAAADVAAFAGAETASSHTDGAAENEDLLELPVEAVVSPAESAPEAEPSQPAQAESGGEPCPPCGAPIEISDIAVEDILEAALAPETAKEPEPTLPAPGAGPRAGIVIADMAASGRRLIERRLEGLPHLRVEAKNCNEIVQACAEHEIGLIILDADMPENEVKAALESVNATVLKAGFPPVPCLCLISHVSQEGRMRKAGCTECQLKTVSRADFQGLVQTLAPHPQPRQGARPSEATLTHPAEATGPSAVEPDVSPRVVNLSQIATQEKMPPATEIVVEGGTAKNTRAPKLDRSVPMLDLIVSSLDSEAVEQSAQPDERTPTETPPLAADRETRPTDAAALEQAGIASFSGPLQDGERSGGNEQTQEAETPADGAAPALGLTKLSGTQPGAPEEFMDAAKVTLIPGFLEVLQDTLLDLARSVNQRNAAAVREIAERMGGQGKAFGLSNLSRMAACVERAAEAEDQEAIGDLAEELLNLGNRYLYSLRLTYQDYEKGQ